MFHFPPFALSTRELAESYRLLQRQGFPIRGPLGQSLLSSSPRIFAASRALHRISMPRHSPHALSSLPTNVVRIELPLEYTRLTNVRVTLYLVFKELS